MQHVAAVVRQASGRRETVPFHREAVGDRSVVQRAYRCPVVARQRRSHRLHRGRDQAGGEPLDPRVQLGDGRDLHAQHLGRATDFIVQVGDLRWKNQLVRPVARIEPHQRPEGRGRGIALLLEQLGGGEIRQGPRPLRVGKRAGLPAQQALAQQRHRGIVLELLIGADALLQQFIGRLRRQPYGRGDEEREGRQRTRHRQRSTSVMSVIRSRWPVASSIKRS